MPESRAFAKYPMSALFRFYLSAGTFCVSLEPIATCHFCGGRYYVWKLAVHEEICSSRPKRLTVEDAVAIAIRSHPEASTNCSLLVRLVWEIRDGYRTAPSRERLTEPTSIVAALQQLKRNPSGEALPVSSAR